jgi:NitT/TauT family transport system ATP-binding protein
VDQVRPQCFPLVSEPLSPLLPPDPTAVARAPAPAVGVHVKHVSRTFEGGVTALSGVDLTVAPGEFVALLGPSGCGKSTLLRLVAGLDRADGGVIEVGEAGGQSSGVAFVFQDAHLLPREAEARAAIEAVGLLDAATRRPAELSGGMRMRVSLARALVTHPRLLLLDEPFAALDELTRHRLDDQLRALWLAQGMTVLFVTHSITEAAYLADRAVVFSPRPARIVADLRVDLPRERSSAIRTGATFQEILRALFDALSGGGA